MLRFSALAFAVLALGLQAGQPEFKDVEEAKAAAFKTEEQKLWKQIRWRTDPAAAQAESQKTGKPLMVFMLVGEWGRKEASQC